MPKRKKRGNSEEKKTDEPETKNTVAESPNDPVVNLAARINEAAEGLFYISETDADIAAFVGKPAEKVDAATLLAQTGNAAGAPTEERNFDDFFARLTKIQDWHGEEEAATAKRFAELKNILEMNLRDLRVFKVGRIELKVYAVGLEATDVLMGIETEAVET